MKKCKIKLVKYLGTQKTYNVTMKSNQHNYKIVSSCGRSIYSKNSHSAAYAMIAYQCCYLKVYYPLEFMCNLLSSEIKNNDQNQKLGRYHKQATDMDLVIKTSDINTSGVLFKVEDGVREVGLRKGEDYSFIRTPLTTLSGVGNKAVDDIMLKQPFTGLQDYLTRIDNRKVNSRTFKTLVEGGCMRSWKESSRELLANYDGIKKKVEKSKKLVKKHEDRIEKFGGSIFDRF